ncbi:MAG: SulP family inorganic anion transporter [Flavobacteriales bacterium]|nr:SulP family inorganic anion transporter [Flavobacteriales bacterium]
MKLTIDTSNIKGDILGGVTAGIVALPLAVAFGVQTFADLYDLGIENASVLGAQAGLYGAIAIGILAAIFGGTKTQISGPTAPMSVIAAGVIVSAFKMVAASQAAEGLSASEVLDLAMPVIIATFLIAGIFEALFGVLKIGKYIRYIPYPVVSGFMSGIGVIIILGQIFPFFGAVSPPGGSVGVVTGIMHVADDINWIAFGCAATTVAIIYLFPKVTKVIPSALVALVGISTASYFFLDNGTVPIIGDIPSGLPELKIGTLLAFDISYLKSIIVPGITLAALGSIDSLLTSVVADNVTKTKHDSNRELIGQGIGNIGGALIGGLPGAGATLRTMVNINAGGKTRISGVTAGLFLFIIMMFMSPLVGEIPKAVLAGILMTVGIGIIDLKGIKHVKEVPLADSSVMFVVLFMTVFVDLIQAVAVGMVLASVLFMKKMGDIVEEGSKSAGIKKFKRESPWKDEKGIPPTIVDGIFIKHLDGPLFFGFTSHFSDMQKAMPKVKMVIIRMKKVPYIDQSGLYALEDGILDLISNNIVVAFTGLKGQPLAMLRGIDLVPGLVPESFLFTSFRGCMKWLKATHEETNGFEAILDDFVSSKNKQIHY